MKQDALTIVQEFIEAELEHRQMSGLPGSDHYISSATKALAAATLLSQSHEYVFDYEEAKGTVRVSKGNYGLEIDLMDGSDHWAFTLDLFYLATGNVNTEPQRCAQVVIHKPNDPYGDPIRHVRVFPDGRLEDFEC